MQIRTDSIDLKTMKALNTLKSIKPSQFKEFERLKNIQITRDPKLDNQTINKREISRTLLLPEEYKIELHPVPYTNSDIDKFINILNDTKLLNEEFNKVSDIINNSQIFHRNSIGEVNESELKANPALGAAAYIKDTEIKDSKIFNLFPPLVPKLLFEGLGQNKYHKWHLMDHTRNVMLYSHRLANKEFDNPLIKDLSNMSPRLKNIITHNNLSKEDKENLYMAGFFHDLGKNTDHVHKES